MITVPLHCHPGCPPPSGLALTVDLAWRADGGLSLTYHCVGPLGEVRLPARQAPGPADALWRHTCCEAFIAPVDGTNYREFNFSPSGRWAAYDFADYRQRNAHWLAPAAPDCHFSADAERLCLAATLPAALLAAGPVLLGLSAVIETRAGDLTYWALSHAGARPDFHLRAGFALALPRP